MITSGEGRYKVWLKEERIGNDRLYILGGGEKPHIGGMVVMWLLARCHPRLIITC